jgi:hypothetical protein
MNEQEVQAIFERFATRLLEAAPPGVEDRAEVLVKYFWLALIGGPKMEEGIWESLRKQPEMEADDVGELESWYRDELKHTVTSKELKALRQRYDVDPQDPHAAVEAAQEQIFQEIRFPSRRSGSRTRVGRIVLLWGLAGGFYGAAVGSLLASMETARLGATIGGGLLAITGAVAGAWYGFFVGQANRIRFGRLYVGSIGAVFGGLSGVFFGAAIPAYIGTVPGFLIGAIAGQKVMPRRPFLGTLLGVFVGVGIGALIAAFLHDGPLAMAGVRWGSLIGAAGGILLLAGLLVTMLRIRGFPM